MLGIDRSLVENRESWCREQEQSRREWEEERAAMVRRWQMDDRQSDRLIIASTCGGALIGLVVSVALLIAAHYLGIG